MDKRRLRWIIVFSVIALATFVNVRYEKLEWGGYWSVDFVAPWRR